MAGGKETPRQKMIGMMYLVLTALLALNVSSAVLEKFAILNTTLEAMIKEVGVTNGYKLAGIKNTKSEKPEVLQAVAKAEQVRKMTQKTLTTLDSIKKVLSTDYEGLPLVGAELVGNTNLAEEKMLDEQSTLAPAYEKILTDYHGNLQEISKMKFPPLTKKAVDFPELKNENGKVEHADLNFIDFSFEGTPTMPAITSITQMQTQILEYEGLVLDSLNDVAQGQLIKFDKVVPMVIGPTVVAAGAKYEGRMFMAGASSGATPEMYRDGTPLSVLPDPETGIKMAKVEFTASAGKKSFLAVIKTAGQDPFSREIKYDVILPTIRVTTGNRPTLYMNCGNFVNFEVPALGASYNPTFSAKGATLKNGDKIGKVVIVPKQRKVFVTVINGGTSIGTEEFDVKQIPKPRYEAKDNSGKLIDLKKGVRSSGLSQVRVSAESDENFKEEVPKDARYRIRKMEVTWVRGINPVAPPMTVTSELVNLNSWRGSGFRGGDRIVVDIKEVTRRTYLDEEEKVDVLPGTNIISIPIDN